MGKSAKSVKKAKMELKEKQTMQGTSLKEKKNVSTHPVHKSTTTKHKSSSIEKKPVAKAKQQRKTEVPKQVSVSKKENKISLPKIENKEFASKIEDKVILPKLGDKNSVSISANENKELSKNVENKELTVNVKREEQVKKEAGKQNNRKKVSSKPNTAKKSNVKKKEEKDVSTNVVPPLEIPRIKNDSMLPKVETKPSVKRTPSSNTTPVKKNGQVVGQVKKKTSSVKNIGIAHANTSTTAKSKGSFELPKKKSTVSAEDSMLKLVNELKEENKKRKEQTKNSKKKVSSQTKTPKEEKKEIEKDLLQNIVQDIEKDSLLTKEEKKEESEQVVQTEEKQPQKRADKYAHRAVPVPTLEQEEEKEVDEEQISSIKKSPYEIEEKEIAEIQKGIDSQVESSLEEEKESEEKPSIETKLTEEQPLEEEERPKEEGDLYLESPLTEEQIAATESVPVKEKKKKEKKRLTKVGLVFKVLAWISLLFFLVSTTYFMRRVFLIDLVPVKYLYIAILVLSIMGFILLLFAKSRKKILHFLQILISLVFGGLFLFGAIFIMKSESSLRSLFSEEENKTTYYVLSLKESEYDSLESLENQVLGLMRQNSTPVKEALNKYQYEYREYEAVGALTSSLVTDTEETTDALVIDSNIYESLPELDSELYEKVRVIYEFELHVEKEDDAILEVIDTPIEQDPEIPEEPERPKRNPNLLDGVNVGNSYIIYISGIDGGGYARPYGLSDVNILVVINPDTHRVLLVSTPRDYYVQVAGTTGMKDKLTHAGLYGINASIGTIQNLYGVKIQNYVKVTFGAIETLVDDIGGVTVYSDTAFYSSHKKGWYVEKGMNFMDGKKALAYSRERYAYAGGDRHRIKNQQDVIAAIIKKVATDPQQLLKFNAILNDMNPYISTDISYDRMQQMVKEQLNTLRPWSVSSISVNGTNGRAATASWPSQITYVMYPTESTIVEAQAKILQVMTGA